MPRILAFAVGKSLRIRNQAVGTAGLQILAIEEEPPLEHPVHAPRVPAFGDWVEEGCPAASRETHGTGERVRGKPPLQEVLADGPQLATETIAPADWRSVSVPSVSDEDDLDAKTRVYSVGASDRLLIARYDNIALLRRNDDASDEATRLFERGAVPSSWRAHHSVTEPTDEERTRLHGVAPSAEPEEVTRSYKLPAGLVGERARAVAGQPEPIQAQQTRQSRVSSSAKRERGTARCHAPSAPLREFPAPVADISTLQQDELTRVFAVSRDAGAFSTERYLNAERAAFAKRRPARRSIAHYLVAGLLVGIAIVGWLLLSMVPHR